MAALHPFGPPMYGQYPGPMAMAACGKPLCILLCTCMMDCAHAQQVDAPLSNAVHRVWGLSSASGDTKQQQAVLVLPPCSSHLAPLIHRWKE